MVIDGNCTNGYGTYRYSDGTTYRGEWKNGEPHGKGRAEYLSRGVYQGEWRDGKPHGQGSHKYSDGGIYTGEFLDGDKHGQGTYRYPNGSVYTGDWEYNNMHGRGSYKYPNGDVYNGKWKNDKRDEGCYVATMVYGDYDHPQVIILRGFRDSVLTKSILGRAFIRFYYHYSPIWVKYMQNRKTLNFIIKNILNKFIDIYKK